MAAELRRDALSPARRLPCHRGEPTAAGETVDGERFHARLEDVPEPIDLVNVFRRPDAVGDAVDQAIAVNAPALWMQLGIRHDAAGARAEAAGIAVVMNRCISVEHARLMRP